MKLVWPLPKDYQKITTHHGENGHVGIDISVPNGNPVYATHDGTVHYEWTTGGGNVVRLIGLDCYTRYCHLASYTAADCEQIKAGVEIARSNNTGNLTTGPHLHWELHKPDGTALDPLLYMREEDSTVPSLYSFQFQNPQVPREIVDKVKASGLKVVKVIDPDCAANVWAGTGIQILARFYMSDQDNKWAHSGRYGARLWFEAVKPRIQKCLDMGMTLFAVETVNEENPQGMADCIEFSDYSDECSILLHSMGQKSCVYNFGEGNPFEHAGNYLVRGLMQADYLGLHEYHMSAEWQKPVADDTWHMLRYRRLVAEIRAVPGAKVPPILITESGIDVPGGWRQAPGCTPAAYVEMMYDYERECKKEGLVKYIFPFISNPYQGQWQSFNNDGEVNDMFLTHIKLEGTPQPETPIVTAPTQADIEKALGDEAQIHIVPLNPNAALERAMATYGLLPASGEFDKVVGDKTYRCQAARSPGERQFQYIFYAVSGQWDVVKSFKRTN